MMVGYERFKKEMIWWDESRRPVCKFPAHIISLIQARPCNQITYNPFELESNYQYFFAVDQLKIISRIFETDEWKKERKKIIQNFIHEV